MIIKIPTYEEAAARVQQGQATPLDVMVANNEPAGPQEKCFREELQAAVDYVWQQSQGVNAAPAPDVQMPAPSPSGPHPSHTTRISMDASTYDEICTVCGATDQVPGGWGKLALPCPGPAPSTSV